VAGGDSKPRSALPDASTVQRQPTTPLAPPGSAAPAASSGDRGAPNPNDGASLLRSRPLHAWQVATRLAPLARQTSIMLLVARLVVDACTTAFGFHAASRRSAFGLAPSTRTSTCQQAVGAIGSAITSWRPHPHPRPRQRQRQRPHLRQRQRLHRRPRPPIHLHQSSGVATCSSREKRAKAQVTAWLGIPSTVGG
jgi:hypothetical protein